MRGVGDDCCDQRICLVGDKCTVNRLSRRSTMAVVKQMQEGENEERGEMKGIIREELRVGGKVGVQTPERPQKRTGPGGEGEEEGRQQGDEAAQGRTQVGAGEEAGRRTGKATPEQGEDGEEVPRMSQQQHRAGHTKHRHTTNHSTPAPQTDRS